MRNRYVIGVDIGGTFTDCAIVASDGSIATGKAPTTPDDLSVGFHAAIAEAAGACGLAVGEILQRAERIVHGTTIGINAIITRRGCKVGLITTKGHGEALRIMDGAGRTSGLSVEEALDTPGTDRPVPIVPRQCIAEVTERIDSTGEVVVPLDVEEVRTAIQRLLDEGVEALGVSFLWSFLNASHELRVRELIEEMAPDIFVTLSSEVAPRIREYPRAATVAMNCYIGPLFVDYVDRLERSLARKGYAKGLAVSQCTGGLQRSAGAKKAPIHTAQSGPVMGIAGSAYLGALMGHHNVLATDMGGTTFDVGLVVGGRPITREESIIGRYELHLPMVDVESIGAGGGSIAWIDEASGALRVGPMSAGAVPGPACYGRGGSLPTVTDADVVLGTVNPGHLLGGKLKLDAVAARRSIEGLADRLGLTPHETAAGIVAIVDHNMADLLRRMTLYRGHDPRDFLVYAFGGAGPVHAGLYASELGIEKVVVPLGNAASVWAALGGACSDVSIVHDRSGVLVSPFDGAALESAFGETEREARRRLLEQGVPATEHRSARSAFMRFRGQMFDLELDISGITLRESADELPTRFVGEYERQFGVGTPFAEAGIQISAIRVRAFGITRKPALTAKPGHRREPLSAARLAPRSVYWAEERRCLDTPVYDGARLEPGHHLTGPAIIELPYTTVAVRPTQSAEVDEYGSVVLEIRRSS